jgi:hypothetical protein
MAAKMITLRKSVRVIPLGIAMGVGVMAMIVVRDFWLAAPLLVLIGMALGFFVVPMNALLQHRGHILMGAGHSIAVQNFNENLSILIMTTGYSVLIRANLRSTGSSPCSACWWQAPCGWSSCNTIEPAPARRRRPPGRRRPSLIRSIITWRARAAPGSDRLSWRMRRRMKHRSSQALALSGRLRKR